jgi:hypothetical protein
VAYLRFDDRGGWPPEGPPPPLLAAPPTPPPRCPWPKLVERAGLLAWPSPLSPRWDINPLSFRSPPPPGLLPPLIQSRRGRGNKSPGNPPARARNRNKQEKNNRNGPERSAGRARRPGEGDVVVVGGRTWGPGRAAAPRVCGRVQWRRRWGRDEVRDGFGGEVGAKRKGDATRWELVLVPC